MTRPFILLSRLNTMSPVMRLLAAILGLALLVFLFWIGMFVFLAFAAIGVGLAAINAIKMKLTGRPLFASRFQKAWQEQQRRYQQQRPGSSSRSNSGRVIEGEVVDKDDDPKS